MSPATFVFLPAQSRNGLRGAIIETRTAQLTMDARGLPSTCEGQDARSAMQTRRGDADRRIRQTLEGLLQGVQVYQSGGHAVDGADQDKDGWNKVRERARKGETEPLEPIGHDGDTDQHPVCAAVLKALGGGKKGAEVCEPFGSPPYGWPQDAKAVERNQLTTCSFKPETVTISLLQRIQIRKAFQEAGVNCQPAQETEQALLRTLRELAGKAGGEAPKPATPEQSALEALNGNALLAEL